MNSTITNSEQFQVSLFEEVQKHVRYEAEFINSILNASLDGVFVCDAVRDDTGKIEDLMIKRINPAFTRIRKLNEKDVVGNKYLSLFPTAKLTGMFDLYCQVIETAEPAHKEFHYKGEESDAWFDISVVKFGEDGLIVTFHDFTAFKNLQLQLEQKIKELEWSNRNLESFVFASSHDLKEPLRKVLIFADQLKTKYSTTLDIEGIRYLGRMEAGVERMRKLVDDLLVYSEIDLKPHDNQTVDLNKIVGEAVLDLELRFIEKKATIQIDDLPVVKGNPQQFHQLFQNLIENSLKFSCKNKPVKIRLTAEKILGKDSCILLPAKEWDNLFYEIALSDNGLGFDQQYAPKIFNVFQRLHSEYSGAGIGLFIARKVVEKHNGWISASSEEGNGTKMTILIPCT
jgi:signal transduction histidine kinase